jgi:hypothetical protein
MPHASSDGGIDTGPGSRRRDRAGILMATTLRYGQTTGIGPFTCRSEGSGVTCRVASGRGFTISTSGIAPVG